MNVSGTATVTADARSVQQSVEQKKIHLHQLKTRIRLVLYFQATLIYNIQISTFIREAVQIHFLLSTQFWVTFSLPNHSGWFLLRFYIIWLQQVFWQPATSSGNSWFIADSLFLYTPLLGHTALPPLSPRRTLLLLTYTSFFALISQLFFFFFASNKTICLASKLGRVFIKCLVMGILIRVLLRLASRDKWQGQGYGDMHPFRINIH